MGVRLGAAAGTLLPTCPMGKVPSGHTGPARAVPASSCRLEIPMSCCKTITKENYLKSGLQLRNLGLLAMVAVGPQLGDGARSSVLLLSLQCPDHPCRGWDITWRELLVFPVEESVWADLPAGFDLPFVVQAERVCACARQEPLRERFARLTQ